MAPREEADENTSRSTLWLLLALTFSTGMIDALSWLGLNGVFTANMTGNVLIIGMGAVGAGGAHWAPPLAALVIFLLGAATAGRLQRGQPPGWSRRTTAIFAVVGAIVAALGAASLAWPPRHFDASAYLVMSALAFAMGAQGAEAMRLAVPQIICGCGVVRSCGARHQFVHRPARSQPCWAGLAATHARHCGAHRRRSGRLAPAAAGVRARAPHGWSSRHLSGSHDGAHSAFCDFIAMIRAA